MDNKNEEFFPDKEQTRLIFKDTYNFYLKWIAVKEPEWRLIILESREIEKKHPFELCGKILVEIVAILEANVMTKEDG